MTRKYFAYGSNMNSAQFAKRCPNYKLVGIGKLEGYNLVFPRSSMTRKCGVASIAEMPGTSVWGVMFELNADDIACLNRREGYDPNREKEKNSYNCVGVSVELSGGAKFDCFTYVAVAQAGKHLPSAEYISLIVDGAKEHKLPDNYIRRLQMILTKE